ncbi:hypothetical protein CAOG_06139 [Capsaspora owczarzaki ATCC 30864]|uniref:Tetraspanin n=3 Tax=Capsaspora owczarzaki TaxID=192875 RepID=A0A0D2VW33_CAPO3|nr:hypothetical protein CAOG_06139 [Capsaspora owczarzaki ATCC 30864]KJE95717.1 hypothetical protein CAOG_006139 [Capsaspora owczarzaki ATCC 30864]|eukprot:XP_004345729.1 hypothetical protein CAOG_06139 [Capsaspora owczarzaki ATCC 30864]
MVKNAKCSKAFLIVYNLFFVLLGGGMLGLGIYGRVGYDQSLSLLTEDNLNNACYVLIACGAVVFLTSFLGCCGAMAEKTWMLKIYTVIMTITLLLEIAIAVLGFVYRTKMNGIVTDQITDQITKAKAGDANAINRMDVLQNDFTCCGITSYSDWNPQTPPQSCCEHNESSPTCGSTTSNLYDRGCASEFSSFMETNLLAIGITAVIIAVLQLISISAARSVYHDIEGTYA